MNAIKVILFALLTTSAIAGWDDFNYQSAKEAEEQRVEADLFRLRGHWIATEDYWQAGVTCFVLYGSGEGFIKDFKLACTDMLIDWYSLHYEDPHRAFAYFKGQHNLNEYFALSGRGFYSEGTIASLFAVGGIDSPGAHRNFLEETIKLAADYPKTTLLLGGAIAAVYLVDQNGGGGGGDNKDEGEIEIETANGTVRYEQKDGYWTRVSINPDGSAHYDSVPESVALAEIAQSSINQGE